MDCKTDFSGPVREYLCRFQRILADMIEGMTGAPLTDSISHNFIVQMIPHHRAAIEMSENLLEYSDYEPLRRIAQGIIQEQTQSIQDMEQVLRQCSRLENSPRELGRYERRVRRILGTMFCAMRGACADNNINGNFMREMIPHHLGAIEMSKNALEYDICPELAPILQAIISSQETGVREMRHLLCCPEA